MRTLLQEIEDRILAKALAELKGELRGRTKQSIPSRKLHPNSRERQQQKTLPVAHPDGGAEFSCALFTRRRRTIVEQPDKLSSLGPV
jgi:hypothetical protein